MGLDLRLIYRAYCDFLVFVVDNLEGQHKVGLAEGLRASFEQVNAGFAVVYQALRDYWLDIVG